MSKKIKYFLVVLFTFTSIVTACNKLTESDSITVQKKSVNFIVIGDWGRNGDYLQRETAVQLNKSVRETKASFVVSTGDNFYENGIASIDDPQWWFSFEDVYRGANLYINWYAVLGNHDYHGSAKAQIDYSKKSRRWRMPNYYYSFERKIPSSSEKILFVFLDTNQFEKNYYQNEEKYPELIKQDSKEQLKWIDSVFAASNAAWKIVIGHHHVYTGGSRKDQVSETGLILEPILKKYGVNAYFCGHEHDLQYLKPKGNTHFIISGAGSELRPTSYLPITKFAKSENGFVAASITQKELLIEFINYKGELIYKKLISK